MRLKPKRTLKQGLMIALVLHSISAMTRFFIISFISLMISISAWAGNTPTLTQLSQSESDAIMKNFGNAIAFRSLEPPSSNGKIWGFGFGLVFEATGAKDLNDALISHGTPQNIPALPAADLVFTIQGPLGISAEAGFLPSKSIKGFSLKRSALNVKWTFTDLALRNKTPFDAAFRVGYGRNEFSYDQVVSGVNDRIEFSSKALRLELAMSRKFLFVEPYLGFGLLRTSSTLSNTAAQPLYSFTASDTYDYSKSSFLFNVGSEFHFSVLVIGAELEWAFSETTLAAKLGFKF